MRCSQRMPQSGSDVPIFVPGKSLMLRRWGLWTTTDVANRSLLLWATKTTSTRYRGTRFNVWKPSAKLETCWSKATKWRSGEQGFTHGGKEQRCVQPIIITKIGHFENRESKIWYTSCWCDESTTYSGRVPKGAHKNDDSYAILRMPH